MPLSINFRWKTPNVSVSTAEEESRAQGFKDLANGIGAARDRRYMRQQTERRNAIEDEDRRRRIEDEERRKQVYGEAAEMMRGKAKERSELVREAEMLRGEIAELKARIGG